MSKLVAEGINIIEKDKIAFEYKEIILYSEDNFPKGLS
jgi:hypothetical protein